MPPRTTLWKREPHTEGKHRVLREYLNAWLPIMTRWNGRVLFIDGFAGPGEYEGGEEGSPLIALRALCEHNHKRSITAEVKYLFVESDRKRASHLQSLLDGICPTLPSNATFSVLRGSFDDSLGAVLDALAEQQKLMAPAFVMIDPFGVSGIPMSLIERILGNPKCEVYISFMYESMNRFIATPEYESHLHELFGTDRWMEAIDLRGDSRKRFLYGLYETQLRAAGAAQVVHFDLYEGNRLVYAIFFGSQHYRGSDKMKSAIWKAAPTGDYSFRGSRDDQLILSVTEPDYLPLRKQLLEEFGDEGWVTVEDVLDFVASDQTDYHTGQVKTPVLRPLENEGRLEVDETTRKNRGSHPAGCRLRFTSSTPD